jgi:hypothetical protein
LVGESHPSGRADGPLTLLSNSKAALAACVDHISAFARALQPVAAAFDHLPAEQQPLSVTFRGGGPEDGFVHPRRTLDTLFFDEKPRVATAVARFKAGTLVPRHLPLDAKLCWLLFGPPGSGKTALASAIANELRRPLHVVNMRAVRTLAEMAVVVARAKREVVLLDEVDAVLGVLSRRTQEAPGKLGGRRVVDEGELQAFLDADEETRRDMLARAGVGFLKHSKEAPLDLHGLLSLLDGVACNEGATLLATTNYPQAIDAALLRPGRFATVEMGYCSPRMAGDIVAFFFQLRGERAAAVRTAFAERGVRPRTAPVDLLHAAQTADDAEHVVEQFAAHPGKGKGGDVAPSRAGSPAPPGAAESESESESASVLRRRHAPETRPSSSLRPPLSLSS